MLLETVACTGFLTRVCITQHGGSLLRVQYNNVLRAVLKKPRRCSASKMFADARVDDFDAIIRASICVNDEQAREQNQHPPQYTGQLSLGVLGWCAHAL
ncbi:jg10059 [Pararge aegeria aegeria]|uniref:Jg10059 protein n=1 Tax=Pararge aegeria aegeria TaxID=348720 RepID=A0A8S4SE76_9NEOP|nr:jg10059 [Pararge aegeria aegeria]